MFQLIKTKTILSMTFFIIFMLSGCKEEGTNSPIQPPTTKTYSIRVTNNLTNNYYNGDIDVKIGSLLLANIAPGNSRTVSGITEGVHTISADGNGFINISASIPVFDNFHACIEGGKTIQDIPFWVACP